MSRRRLANLFGLAAIGALALEPAIAAAQPYPMASLPPSAYMRGGQTPITSAVMAPAAQAAQTVRVDLGGPSGSRTLTLPRGKSAVVDLPVDARDVVVRLGSARVRTRPTRSKASTVALALFRPGLPAVSFRVAVSPFE